MATYNEILNRVGVTVRNFTRGLTESQRLMFKAVEAEVARLDLYHDGKVRTTAKNLRILASIKAKIVRVMMTDEYRERVKDLVAGINEVTRLSNEYWKKAESGFKPRALLKELRKGAIDDVVTKLTDAGIGVNVGDKIVEILRTNITTGGSYSSLTAQLRDGLLNTEQKGYLDRYGRQVATDSVNQYAAQYNQVVSSDLGYQWFKYDNTDIETTRPFCDAMTDQPYFHVSEIPRILRAENLYYTKDGVRTKVEINPRTGLPHGMIPGTNAENFQVRRGGYNCGHQIRPVNERQVPDDVVLRVKASPEYARWVRQTSDKAKLKQ